MTATDARAQVAERRVVGRRRHGGARRAVAPLVGIVVFAALWEGLLRGFDVKPFIMPGPWRILRTIGQDPGFFWREGLTTAKEAGAGLGIGLLLSVVVAIPMAGSRFVERAVQPVALLVQVIPLVCYAPAFVIWLNTGFKPIAAVSALVCFVPLLYNLVAGLRAADRDTRDLLRSAGASRAEILRHVEIPSALPHLFAGLRTAVGLALVGAVIGEWFALVPGGLGVWIRKAQATGSGATLVWACAFALGAIGALSLVALAGLERLLLRGTHDRR